MKIYPLVRAEFARLTASRIGIASLVALMTVPLVYGGLYLWGNQDPYSSLDKVPAALVVQDAGSTVEGKVVNYGKSAAKSLTDGKKFDWVTVTAAQAEKGVKNGTYDFGLTFPTDFSKHLSSAAGDMPVAASLKLTTDDTNSYLSTTIAKQAAEAVRVEIAKEVGATASVKLLGSVASIRDGLVEADDGAGTLADGASSADGGAASLSSGTATLSSGATRLSAGLATLDAKAGALPSTAASLSGGATAVSNGLSALANGSGANPGLVAGSAGAARLAAGTRAGVVTALTSAGVDPAVIAGVDAQLGAVSVATGSVAAGAQNLGALSAGATRVASGAAALSASAPTLSSAVHTAAAGAGSLSTGAAQAASGASELSSGLDSLAGGSTKLHNSLTDAVRQIPKTTTAERTAASNLLANPLAVKQTAVTEAQNYGAGLAPFFLALASWIGIYALFLLVRPLSRRALTAVRRPIRTTIAGWFTPAVLGVLQMVALFALVTLGLQLSVANPLGLVAFMAFVAITFAAIVLALNVLLGSVGQFLALVFMVIQLVTAGGTFPWQTLPGPLAALHRALPMSHAVDGIRQLMYGGLSTSVWSAILPLLLWLIGSLIVATLGAARQGRFRILRELRPSPLAA